MFKKIKYYFKQNLILSLRNNMIIYMTVFPILLALGLSFFMPNVTEIETTIAVDNTIEQNIIDKLEDYGSVTIYNNLTELKKRVNQWDDVAGITKAEDKYNIILEGNEPEETAEMSEAVLNQIINQNDQYSFDYTSLEKDNSSMVELAGSLVLLTIILISGLTIGLGIIDEKENAVINALSVSPISLKEFILSKSIISIFFAIALSFITVFIMVGNSVNYWLVLIAVLASVNIGIIWGFLIGGIADNLIGAIGVIKSTALFLIAVPMASVYTPIKFHWVYYIFPNYWAFKSYQNIFNQNQWINFNYASIITFIFSLGLLLILTPYFKRKLNIR